MNKYDFKVEQPTLLAATFSVKTNCDTEPIIARVNEQGHWAFTVPKDLPATLLSKVQDVCEMQFSPSTLAHIRANRFFDEAIAEAKDIPSPDDGSYELFSKIVKRIITSVDTPDLYLFKDFLTDQLTFESLGNALLRLSTYIKLKKEKEV